MTYIKRLLTICRFQAFDMYTDGHFIMNLRLDVCLEALQVPNCNVSVDVLKNYYLPKKLCKWDAQFTTPGNFICCLQHKSIFSYT